MTPRVLVTGAGGFLGSRVVESLGGLGAFVSGIGRAEHEAGPKALAASVAAFSPEVVLHLATRFQASHEGADIPDLISANVTFGALVAEAAADAGARFVNVGSAWQHFEGAGYAPVSLYAATKQALTAILEYYQGLRGLVVDEVTLFDTYGPGDPRRKLIPVLIEAARTGAHLPMSSGRQLIDLTYVDDVVRALVSCVLAPSPVGSVVVRSGASLSVREVVARAERTFGARIDAGWGELEDRPREMTSDWVFGTPLEGWSPTISLDEGLRRTWAA